MNRPAQMTEAFANHLKEELNMHPCESMSRFLHVGNKYFTIVDSKFVHVKENSRLGIGKMIITLENENGELYNLELEPTGWSKVNK